MAAAFAAQGNARVTLLERTKDGGRKILISGGGRCNVLPSAMQPNQYITASSPNTMKKMLLSWPLTDQQRFFADTLAVPLALEPETGKLFPLSNHARDVRDALLRLATQRGVDVRFDSALSDIVPAHDGKWRITTNTSSIEADAV